MEKVKKTLPVILAIDDMPMNLRMIKVFLEHEFVVIPVKTALEGLGILKTKKIDIILLDIGMPGMGGFEFIAEMKKMPEKKDTPVICVTGLDATPEFITQVISTGAKDFITKPYDAPTLKVKVRKVLNITDG